MRFIKPNGACFDSIIPGHTHSIANWRQLPEVHQRQGILIDKRTAVTRWAGESLDYGIAIEGMLHRIKRNKAQHNKNVSAETTVSG